MADAISEKIEDTFAKNTEKDLIVSSTELKAFLVKNKLYFKELLHKEFSDENPVLLRDDLNRIQKAFEVAHRIRDFELNLYWQRLNYLWVIAALLLAGWGVLASKLLEASTATSTTLSIPPQPSQLIFLSLGIISIAGCFFSLLSLSITEAGKYWQMVWEEHIYKLEPFISGSIYNIKFGKLKINSTEIKTTNPAPKNEKFEKIPSISKSIETIIWGIFCVWTLSLGFSACLAFGTMENPNILAFIAALVSVAILTFLLLRFRINRKSYKTLEIITE